MLEWQFGDIIHKSYRGELISGYIETEQSPSQRRETFTDIDDIRSGYIIVDDIETFMVFFKTDTVNGTIPFNYYDCITETTRIASFVGSPTDTKLSNKYQINITLRLEHLPIENVPAIVGADILTEGDDNLVTEDLNQLITE